MRLAHLHLPGITPFTTVSRLQQTLALGHLAHKKALSQPASPTLSRSTRTPPDPVIITFTPNPVYTTGRRDLPPSNTSSPTDAQPSPAPLSLPPSLEPIRHLLEEPPILSPHSRSSNDAGGKNVQAEYHPTLRGGQTTYHGPGQLVAYTILDLRRLGLSPRCHIRCLENSVIDVLGTYGVRGVVTQDPGVWVDQNSNNNSSSNGSVKKITAVGVHLRRYISTYGIGLNVTNEPLWYFKQIVACGLEGREATSLEEQMTTPATTPTIEEVARRFVDAFVHRLRTDYMYSGKERIDEVYSLGMEDVAALGKENRESL